MSTDAALAAIGAALDSWESGEDAAEWNADGGPDDLAEGPFTAAQLAAFATAARHCGAVIQSLADTMRPVAVAYGKMIGQWSAAFAAMSHPLLDAADRKHHARCPVCNPCANEPPLCIDGNEYHRRQKARRRRNRR